MFTTETGSSYRSLVAGALLFSIGPAAILLMPMIVGVYVDELGFSNRQAGILASIEAAGMGLSSVLGLLWVKRINWRTVTLLGLGASMIANLVATGIHDFTPLMVCRAIASIAAGTAFAVSVASLGEEKKPATAYGVGLAVQTFLMILMMSASATVITSFGIDGLFTMLALLAIIVALPAGWLPTSSQKGKVEKDTTRLSATSTRLLISLALIAMAIHFIGAVAFWTFLERIGNNAGHPVTTIGTILAWALGAGMFGGLLAAWLSDRRGYSLPFIISTVILLASVMIAVDDVSVSMLAVSAIAFDGMWVFANAYQAALVARLDRQGRYVVLVPAAQGTGAMLGPGLASLFISNDSFIAVNIIAGICFILSLVLFLVAVHMDHQRHP